MGQALEREKIMAALWGLLDGLAPFKTFARQLPADWKSVTEQPALFLISGLGHYPAREAREMPPVVTIQCEIFVIDNSMVDPDIIGIEVMNNLVDAVEAAITADEGIGVQDLGGLVSHCNIEGTIEGNPGDISKQGVAKIPISILVNC